MARWQRDPKLRRQLAYLLVAAETLAVAINFYSIFQAYLHRLNVSRAFLSPKMLFFATVTATVVAVVVVLGQGIFYVKGRDWLRWVFLAENSLLVMLGVVWFINNRLGSSPTPAPVMAGLLIPMLTLFPLYWPLYAFRPTMPRPLLQPQQFYGRRRRGMGLR